MFNLPPSNPATGLRLPFAQVCVRWRPLPLFCQLGDVFWLSGCPFLVNVKTVFTIILLVPSRSQLLGLYYTVAPCPRISQCLVLLTPVTLLFIRSDKSILFSHAGRPRWEEQDSLTLANTCIKKIHTLTAACWLFLLQASHSQDSPLYTLHISKSSASSWTSLGPA